MRRKNFWTILMVVVILMFFANLAFADDVSVDVTNHNTNSATATGGNATQDQRQQQQQAQCMTSPRNHIVAPLPGTFVAGPAPSAGNFTRMTCDPVNKNFSIERLKRMASAGNWADTRGTWFNSMFSSSVKLVPYESFDGKVDDQPITRLDFIPIGENDRVLAEATCEGQYGWPLGAAVGKCLLALKEATNTVRVVIEYKIVHDGKGSGTSVGTGAAASKMLGAGGSDDAAGSLAVGGLFGSTYLSLEERYVVHAIAYNDGPVGTPTEAKCEQPTIAAPAPEQVKTCNSGKIISELKKNEQEIKQCKKYCENNLKLRLIRGKLFFALYKCTGDKEALEDAVHNYEIAARNYKFGKDTKNNLNADELMAEVYENWQKAKEAK
jgi:hypothetical protein